MADDTKRIPPLAIIVMVVLVALVVIAFVRWRGTTTGAALGSPPASETTAPTPPAARTSTAR